jgi:hypothetical protein
MPEPGAPRSANLGPAYPADEPQVRVRTVFRERWRRVLMLTGDVDASVTYDSMGWGERVFVDGEVRARTSGWAMPLVYPWVEFTLPGRGINVPARIDVAAVIRPWTLWTVRITHFRLTVARTVVYDEGPDGVRWPPDAQVIDGPVEWDC